MKLSAAIIGCGNIAFGYDDILGPAGVATHAKGYTHCAETELVAAADPSPQALDRAKKSYPIRTYSDYREMLNKERPQLVSICSPSETHLPILEEIVYNYGRDYSFIKGIALEKPVATSIAECSKLRQLAETLKIPVAVNYIRLYDPELANLAEKFPQQIGKIKRVVGFYSKGLLHSASHHLNLLQHYFGELQIVAAKTASESVNIFPYDGAIDLELRAGNLPISLLSVGYQRAICEISFLGEKGILRILDKNGAISLAKFATDSGETPEQLLYAGDLNRATGKFIADLAGVVLRGGKPLCDLQQGIRASELALTAIQLAKS